MAHRGRLLAALWRAALGHGVPLMLLQAVSSFIDDGVSWSTLYEVVLLLPVYAVLAFVFAAFRTRSLARRARGTGIQVTVDALKDTQTHTLQGTPFPCIRAELSGAERAFAAVGADGGNPVLLRWRPFRFRMSVDASVTFDEASGEARLKVSAAEGLPLLHHGAAFVALCQMVRSVTLVDVDGRAVK
ncbi:hypothetical protein ACIPSA_04660 [Streptomyces sp. NPDC086549]|uniref:hypothetical protein n=1 Tax=Streptomyces sp. NPDC086549 TaxID=3365752 RepID=UPI0038212223